MGFVDYLRFVLGWRSATITAAVPKAWRIVAAQVYVPGAVAGEVYVPGSVAGHVYIPGAVSGQTNPD